MQLKTLVGNVLAAGMLFGGFAACTTQEDLGSAEQSVTTAPTTVSATATSDTTIDVSWSAVAGAAKYYVFQATGAGAFAYVATVVQPTTAFSAVGLQPSTSYSFQIMTADVDGSESAVSATATASTNAPGAVPPSNASAVATSSTTIDLTWSPVASALKYYVFQSADGGPFNYVGTVVDPGTSYSATGLTPGTTYAYELETALLDGRESTTSAPVAATTAYAPVVPPSSVSAALTSDTSIDVTWSAVPNALKYYVFQSKDGAPFAYVGTIVAPATTFSASGLAPDSTYSYQVETALNDGRESGPSITASVSTPAANGGAPAMVSATASSDTTIDVTWSAVPNALKYYVFQAQGTGPYVYLGTVVNATTFTATGLTPSTSYSYEIQTSFVDGHESVLSASASATTTGTTPPPTSIN